MTDIVIYSAGTSPFLPTTVFNSSTDPSTHSTSPNDTQRTFSIPVQHNPSRTILIEHRRFDEQPMSFETSRFLFQPIGRTVPIPVEILQSNSSNEHYDYPTNVIESPVTTRRIPTIVPFNALKRMDRLNTVFVKPTRIERPLPKLVFQENELIQTAIDQGKILVQKRPKDIIFM